MAPMEQEGEENSDMIKCSQCPEQATTVKATMEFSAVSASGWQVTEEIAFCDDHAEEEAATA